MAIDGVLTNVKLIVDGYDISGDHNKLALDDGIALYPAPAFGDAGIRRVSGVGDVALSTVGYWNQVADRAEQVLFPNIGTMNVPVSIGPSGFAEGGVAYLFRAGYADYKPEADLDAPGAFTASAMGSAGERLVRGKWLSTNTLRTTGAFTGTAFELGAVSATQKIYVAAHITTYSGGTLSGFAVQSDSAEGFPSPTTRVSLSNVTAVGSQWPTPVAGAITDTWWRVIFTVGGTNATVLVTAGIR